jgi:Protein of unknown function (DUF1579)
MKTCSSLFAMLLMLCAVGGVCAQDSEISPEMKLLAGDVGDWDCEIRMFGPDGSADTTKGTETNFMLGNMWIISHFKGEMMGMPFQGSSQTGFNPETKKYTGSWVDSMSPHAMTMEGEYDEATKTFTSHGVGKDPAGTEMKMKMTTRHNDDGTRLFTMYGEVEGQSMKMMEILYTRAKANKPK